MERKKPHGKRQKAEQIEMPLNKKSPHFLPPAPVPVSPSPIPRGFDMRERRDTAPQVPFSQSGLRAGALPISPGEQKAHNGASAERTVPRDAHVAFLSCAI